MSTSEFDLARWLAGTDLGDPRDFRPVDEDDGEPICPDWTEEALDALPFDPFESPDGWGNDGTPLH